MTSPGGYRGRIAPSPTGHLHLGHARTFSIAQQRALAEGGALVLRIDDLDGPRCTKAFAEDAVEDLRWFGLRWQEGPDTGGPFCPYTQSERMPLYIEAFEHLRAAGLIYPCRCSRQDVLRALSAPHAGEDEPIYPGMCRPATPTVSSQQRSGVNWRFRVADGASIAFHDGNLGEQRAVAGRDFGDFLVWRKDDLPSYQLACAVDDALMQITEVVRGADLVTSTFRQILLFEVLGRKAPRFFHCDLMADETGARLAKRNDALSIRTLRSGGWTAEEIRTAMTKAATVARGTA